MPDTAFPTDYDVFRDPQQGESLEQIGQRRLFLGYNDAIEALERRVGKTGETDPLSHEKRITDIRSEFDSHKANAALHSISGGNPLPTYFVLTPVTWTDQSAALTEFAGATDRRQQVPLANAVDARVVAFVTGAGAAGAELRVQYSTDAGATWAYLDGIDGAKVGIGATGVRIGAWVNLAAAAKADVLVRLVGINGDAAADPAFSVVALQVRFQPPAGSGGALGNTAPIALGDPAAAGVATVASREDHKHPTTGLVKTADLSAHKASVKDHDDVSDTAPTNGQVLVYDSGSGLWVPTTHGSSGDPHTQYARKDLVDAKGDLLVGSAADTLARLGVGANGQVLTADSAQANGLKWAAAGAAGNNQWVGQVLHDTSTPIGTAANSMEVLPVWVDAAMTIGALRLLVGTSSGNISVAVYNADGTSRLGTSGAVPCPAAGFASVALTSNVTLNAGTKYLFAISADNTTATFGGITNYAPGGSLITSAHPCPASFTPASVYTAALTSLSAVPV